ncbi:FtsX-like permease family protein [Streptomyces sp. CA-210063]|uniref:FtsX-like permease family protein n=1 Tax=Streptomyces sp. CA-210063 TaxID=2801029 RepID=UPI00214CEF20|nr:FtsX-like permease family protein [Streptomyces sp. CA-210063]UUU32301.1 FtsX-like permease family protein [Streptomyces sp. CA-210063]
MLRTQLAGAPARPGRLLMTGLSVLVAAFVVFGTVMAQQITEQTTVDRFRGTPEAVDLVVLGDDDVITDAQTKAVQAVPGVAEVATRTENGVSLAEVSRRYLELQGDPGSGPLSRVRLVAGGYPDGPLELAVNRQASQRLDIEPGDRVGLLVPVAEDAETAEGTGETEGTQTVTVTVTGVVEVNSDREATGYAPAAALNAMGHIEGYPRLDVRAEPGVSAEALTERLSAVLQRTSGAEFDFVPGDTVRGEEARAAVDQYADVFRLIAMFLAIAVVAAALVATSTFRVVFAQRLRQLALLRTIGAHRGQLVRALAVEGALVGLVAGTAGVLLALGAGYAAPVIADAAGLSLSAPAVPVAAAVAVVLGAVLVTVGAVLAPASSAAGVSPLQTLRSAGTLAGERGIGRARLGVGLLLAAGAVGLAGVLLRDLPEPGDLNYDSVAGLMLTVLSGTLAFLALITLGPLLVRPLLAVAGWPLRRLGPTGTLAVGGIGGAPRRAAAVSVVVALGVTLVSGTLVGIATLRGHMDRELAVQAPADFDMSGTVSTGETPNGTISGLSADLVRRLKAVPQLTDATAYRQTDVAVGSMEASAIDLDLTALPSSRLLRPMTGTLSELGPGEVIVSSRLARGLGMAAGDSITFSTAKKGTLRMSVAATLPDEGPLGADAIVTPGDLDRMGASPLPAGVLANAAEPGQAARNAAEQAIRETVGPGSAMELRILAEERDDSDADIEMVATLSLGLLGLTVLIAVVGVGTTTGLTVLERTRESGLLRALGLGRSGLRFLIGMEAALYGVLGGLLGLALGVPYAWLAVRLLNIGAPLLLPYGQLLTVFLGLVLVTALAGLLPARRAARVSPVVALGATE